MSTEALEAVRRVSWDGFSSCGALAVLRALAELADPVTHECVADIDYIMRHSCQKNSTVRRHLDDLEADKWFTRERLMNKDGTLGEYRYRLSLEKLGLDPRHRSNRAVDGAEAGAVDNTPASTARFEQTTAQIEQTTARFEQTTAQIGRSLKEELLPSFPSSFIFEDDKERELFVRVFKVVGPGMADHMRFRSVLDSLRRVLPSWMLAYDFELDILPVIEAQTKRPRPASKLLTGFQVMLPDLRTHRAARLPSPNAPRQQQITDDMLLERLRSDERNVSFGRSPIFSTAPSETLEEAAKRLKGEIAVVEQRMDEARKAAKASA